MKRTGPKVELGGLRRLVSEIEAHFISAYLVPPDLNPPSRKEVLAVAAYVVLVHGALENFIEGLALWVVDRSVTNWTTRKKITRSLGSLLLYQDAPMDSQISVFDNIRLSLEQAKSRVSKLVQANNGIGPDHLRTLFLPLGIDVPNDPVLTASLESLVSMRHEWAHQYRYAAKVTKSAKDAQLTVSDCLSLAKMLTEEAVRLRLS